MYLFSMSICSKESFDHVLRWFLLLLTFSPILSFLNVLLSLSFSGELKLELVRLGSSAHWTLRPRHVRHFALNRCLHSLNPFRIEVLKESTFILRELLGEDDLEREGYEQKWQPAEIGKGSFSLLPLSSQIPLSCSMSLSVSALVLAGCLQAPDLPPHPLPFASILPLPNSLFSSLSFPSYGGAFRSELMDLRWCMHSSSRIPSSVERRVVSKKKDDKWDWETWSDRSEPPWARAGGGCYREREVQSGLGSGHVL